MLSPIPPKSFLDGLERDFRGQIRLRWSTQRNRWQIERKGVERTTLKDPRDRVDLLERLRAGFYRVMEVSPGSLITCPHCDHDYHTPIYSLVAPKCPRCEKVDLVMNWPLGEKLLEHLRFSDPERDGLQRLERDQLAQEKAAKDSQDRESRNFGEAVWKEDFNQIFEIQSKGYTGKEHAWEDAPQSRPFGGNS